MKKRVMIAVLVLLAVGLALCGKYQQDRKKQMFLPETTNDFIFSWLW